ncbi:MAG TPA: hypothetical protein VNA20_18445, partial [Frankiaceae bacterium]|nr:hypothetical protein [Frankiaceae bacterium]
PEALGARRAARVAPKGAVAGRAAARVTRPAALVVAPAPPAEEPKPVPRREVGPLVWESPERKDDGAELCLETQQQPVWCASYARRLVNEPPGGPL